MLHSNTLTAETRRTGSCSIALANAARSGSSSRIANSAEESSTINQCGKPSGPYPRMASGLRASRTGRDAQRRAMRAMSSVNGEGPRRRTRSSRSLSAWMTASVTPSPVWAVNSRTRRSASGFLMLKAMSRFHRNGRIIAKCFDHFA
jgi:hypothetical protein